jgi:hypothetical protein
MNTETEPRAVDVSESESRGRGDDRRAEAERRRSALGLFEVRAKREGISSDRRQSERRDEQGGRSWLSFWRREKR